jgi:hypothetical protein
MWCARWTGTRKETTTMKTFVLDADHNITAYASQQQAGSAVPPGRRLHDCRRSQGRAAQLPGRCRSGDLEQPYGVAPVKRFKDSATAAERIFAELQKLRGPDTEAAPANTDAPKAKRAQARR